MNYFFTLIFLLSFFSHGLSAQDSGRPNIIVIDVDELRWDALGITGHPFVRTPNIDRIAKEGMLMKNSFVVSPICGPSRGSILTGQYAHTNGSYKNTLPYGFNQTLTTYPMLLQAAGYKTCFIGKWETGRYADTTPHPGFDRWFCTGPNRAYKMDPTVNVDGVPTEFKGHATDISCNEAVRFIKENSDGPFNIVLMPRSVHTSYGTEDLLASERNRNLYKDVPIIRARSADSPILGQPAVKNAKLPPPTDEGIRNVSPILSDIDDSPIVGKPALKNIKMTPPTDEDIRNISRMLVDIDDGVGLILKTLEEEGILDETMIIFTGDNGFFFGEHGLTEKRAPYEESIRVPFFVRYPPLVKAGSTSEVSILNIDVAPTILSLAGLPIPKYTEGRSFLPVFAGGKLEEPRPALLFEFYPEWYGVKKNGGGIQPWKAVRTDEWKYVNWTDLPNADELYNLVDDPLEMNNLIQNDKYNQVVKDMKAELEKQKKLYNDPGIMFQVMSSYAKTQK
ncbi:N-acetylglucosamine-6-sulfatase [Pricia antarctica]|uniref:N-acetylglucosamine-6-sulfatase n=1 Tax=Pricia antarctica TaxID=641691 RepID=A0A1G7IZS5_9FLAO|nr:sulfatase-like hydrolase/transferase [Pricia antarctica]SDF18242.1 N-acetylglucosamine-6-sulfatase [Pricia antarctica]